MDLKKLISNTESETIEFKESTGEWKEIIETISAFSNTDPKIHPSITIEKIKGKFIIIVEIKESSDHLVLAFGRPYKTISERLAHRGQAVFRLLKCQGLQGA